MSGSREGLIARVIRGSLANPVLVLLIAALLAGVGYLALRNTPVDAIPNLSDVQVIVRTSFPGQAPRVVEDQVTFPLTSALLAVPGAVTVRGYSFFGDSFVYVLFAEGTDPYWARSRVLEYLSQAAASLPPGTRPALGPDATGLGWIYEYALVDRSHHLDLAQLRSIQDWQLKFELQSIEGVSEVATVGGMVKQYQVLLDPLKLRSYGVTIDQVRMAIEGGNRETGGSVIEFAEAEYMVRATGYVTGIEDLERIPVKVGEGGVPVTLGDIAEVRIGPEMRRGIAELDGEGEVVGGIIVMRHGENAARTIAEVKTRLAELARALPPGVEIVPTYDRSSLITRAIDNLKGKLVEEFVVVVLVCAVFLLHLRSSLVFIVILPLGILAAFLVMYVQGINANIMSLGGIAIAIGAMVDASVVMIENVHRRLEGREEPTPRERLEIIGSACAEVGPALFFSLLIVALSFLPVFALEAQEGRLFKPLAYTKTYAMLAAALLSITLGPVLIHLLVRGRIRRDAANPVTRVAVAAYRPLLGVALRHPWSVTLAAVALCLATVWPASRLGTEFMPDMDEGDLLYMPTTLPGLSADAARALLQQTDRLIATVPEVVSVFGKAGRAETATDPAPFEMLETIVQLKPRSQWRPGLTPEKLRNELDERVRLPGLANAWVPPIKTRIDMLATGIRTPVGIKIVGPDLAVIADIGTRIEDILRGVDGVGSVFAERTSSGRYVEIDVDRAAAARYGLNIAQVHELVGLAVGGMTISYSVEGRERYPIVLRYPSELRDSVENLKRLPLVTMMGPQITLGDVARVRITEGPAMIRSENARPAGWLYIDVHDRDLGSFVAEAKRRVAAADLLPAGYSLLWSGQYEYLERAAARLRVVVPLTLAVIVLMLFLHFRSLKDVMLILGSLPVALVGGVWLLWLLDFRVSVAIGVGFIALAGVAAETGIVMLLYLKTAWEERRAALATEARVPRTADLEQAIVSGALLRLRPKLMTVVTIIAGLLPIMRASGAGSEVMQRIAAPMIGGMVSATLLTLLVIPSVFLLAHRRILDSGP
jgi:copper/silver efflux system protein